MAAVPRVIIRRRDAPVLPANGAGRRRGRLAPPARPAIWRLVRPMFPMFLPGLTASSLLSYQGCPQALDHGPRRAQRRPALLQPSRSALREVRSRGAAVPASEVRAQTGAGTGAQMPGMEIWLRLWAAPNRARVRPVLSVKRLLRGRIDDIGSNLPGARCNSVGIDAGRRPFPAILPNSAGCVPGLAENTMLSAYCSTDPFGGEGLIQAGPCGRNTRGARSRQHPAGN